MSAREFKPGDVGVATTGERFIVTRERRCAWATLRGDVVSGEPSPDDRPLVVIDPEDRRNIERLRNLTLSCLRQRIGDYQTDGFTDTDLANAMQAALREFANPTPPKPDEPAAYLAAVVDASGNRWHISDGPTDGDRRWYSPDLNTTRAYADIAAVRVLSEGVRDE